MSNDGKQLEGLVAIVERILLPEGFEVKTNERVVNDEGIQIAEFDIEIHGKVGTTTIDWLIECRDRPGRGPAPGSWIEQLVGRRTRFGFNKVTAVSTTGFAAGATEFARDAGIELREVSSLSASEFEEWLQLRELEQRLRVADVLHANIIIDDGESNERKLAAMAVIKEANGLDAFLVSTVSGKAVTIPQAFLAAVQTLPDDPFEGVIPEKPKRLDIHADYPTPDHFCVITHEGAARIRRIEFFGQLSIQQTFVPIDKAMEYRHFESGEKISQIATFEPPAVAGQKVSIEFHRIEETGLIHVVARKLTEKK